MRSVKTRRGQEGNDNCGMSSPGCFPSVWETWNFRLSAFDQHVKGKVQLRSSEVEIKDLEILGSGYWGKAMP